MKSGAVAMLLVAILGGGLLVWQLRVSQSARSLAAEDSFNRQVLELAELLKARAKLDKQRAELEHAVADVQSSTQRTQEISRQAAAERETNLIVLASTAVNGPGVRLRFTDKPLNSTGLIDLMNTLKNLGAEAIAVNGQRFGPTSSIDDGKFAPPVTIEVIGNPQVLDEGLRQGGGILEKLALPASVERAETLTMSAR
jgi:uncharacterized protein YlxW (UPF0749 family)